MYIPNPCASSQAQTYPLCNFPFLLGIYTKPQQGHLLNLYYTTIPQMGQVFFLGNINIYITNNETNTNDIKGPNTRLKKQRKKQINKLQCRNLRLARGWREAVAQWFPLQSKWDGYHQTNLLQVLKLILVFRQNISIKRC